MGRDAAGFDGIDPDELPIRAGGLKGFIVMADACRKGEMWEVKSGLKVRDWRRAEQGFRAWAISPPHVTVGETSPTTFPLAIHTSPSPRIIFFW